MMRERWWQASLAFLALAALAGWFALAPGAAGWTTRAALWLGAAGLACWAAGAYLRGKRRPEALAP